ncbi:zinc finger cchc domain-containing protein 7 [Limosa lapponica baueri]|uniref:Zinc finger CCHC domain-containing protein 7 n=1 Tax=Limosa lapponica baueri TaxID=1758121 RepID=A0A2I0TZS8_LIMLA|nr:zinc finger cchc domain-containing protein 7 [Limosa lapponica baueri]
MDANIDNYNGFRSGQADEEMKIRVVVQLQSLGLPSWPPSMKSCLAPDKMTTSMWTWSRWRGSGYHSISVCHSVHPVRSSRVWLPLELRAQTCPWPGGNIHLHPGVNSAGLASGEVDVDWSICNKDLEAQISNYASVRHSSLRYYTPDKNVTCRSCGRQGHLSKNCPSPKKVPPCSLCAGRGHLQNSCPARFCLNCCLPGHYFRECLERAYWNKHCNRCDMKGHYADACPEIWRQYHLTTKPGPIKAGSPHPERSASAYCYNCSRKGHFGYECSEKRMQGSMFPTSPFIYYYDDEHDIKKRANRLQRKAAELQEAGLLPEQSETPWQEEKHGGHSHKKKSKPWKEHRKHDKDGKCHKKMKMSRAEKHREEKRRSDFEVSRNLEEDFPRGCKRQARKGSKIRHKSIFQAFSGSKTAQGPLEGAKRKKKWKKQKDDSPDVNENLFLIKQRRKKSKQKSW